MDRSYGGAIVYKADGSTSDVDFDGSENAFSFLATTEFDFFGYSYVHHLPTIQLVVIAGEVGGGSRSIDFGEATSAVEDWDVISFDGLSDGVVNGSANESNNWDVTNNPDSQYADGSTAVVAYVDGAEGVFGSSFEDMIAGDAARNILHGGDGKDLY